MGERADLDAVQARYQTAWELVHGPVPTAAIGALIESQADVPALVAELCEVRSVLASIGAMAAEARAKLLAHAGIRELHPDRQVQPSEQEDGDG